MESGLTAFTGETGAGKSIIVGALSLLFGQRADTASIGPHSDQTEIIAIFGITTDSVVDLWLKNNDIAHDGEIEIRRIIHKSGKSKIRLAGKPSTNKTIQELGELMLQIHGQHDQINLLKPSEQLAIVDRFGSHDKLLDKIKSCSEEWRQLQHQWNSLLQAGSLTAEQLELVQYQFEELENLQLSEQEYEQLHQELKQATHVTDLKAQLAQTLATLNEGDSNVLSLINQVSQTLSQSKGYDFNAVIALLNEASINIEEAHAELNQINQTVQDDPAKLQQTEQRLDQLYTAARRQKVQPEQLHTHFLQLQQQLSQHEDKADVKEQLLTRINAVESEYKELSNTLHKTRSKAAKELSVVIEKKVQSLGLKEARLKINVQQDSDKTPSPLGQDQVEFTVAINQGQSFQSLRKTASGGELSRIALAIEVCTNQQQMTTFVFDEVDTGVGGATAEMIGRLMHQLGRSHQVFAVTHLPQVAGFADQHMRVEKQTVNEITRSQVQLLDYEQRVNELARMSGGEKITEATLAQARDFIHAVK